MNRISARFAGTTVSLLLQALFIAILIKSLPLVSPSRILERELTLIIPRLPHAAPVTPGQAAPGAPLFVAPSRTQAPPPSVPDNRAPPTAILNFGHALNDCALEQFASLAPDQRAGCRRPSDGAEILSAPNLMGSPSHVKDAARWASELDHKRSPLLLPGATKDRFGISAGIGPDGKATGLAALGSSDALPAYDVRQYQPEDFYKQEQAHDAWNKAYSQR